MTQKSYSTNHKLNGVQEIFPDIFLVTGPSIFHFEGNDIQKSNNMIIVRNNHELTLINTLLLDEPGLTSLDALGQVSHVIRLGAFHDRHDLFYLDRYQAKLWALPGMVHKNHSQAEFHIGETTEVPFPQASFFCFATTSHPEAILHINRHGGILVTCDSIKNWTQIDKYFSEKTGKEFLEQGLIAPASIDQVWLGAMKPQASDFLKLKQLQFKHLLSAHGQPLLDTAYEQLAPRLWQLCKC